MAHSLFSDIKAWRQLARLMPGWQPTLRGLQRLDEGPNELLVALRAVARGWGPDDARWDVLQGVLEYCKREHAHELAEKIREDTRAALTRVTAMHGADWGRTWAMGREHAADLIDPEVLNSGS
jgi:hypothetical protein